MTYRPDSGDPEKQESPQLAAAPTTNGNGATGIAAIIAAAKRVRVDELNPKVRRALERLPSAEEALRPHRERNSLGMAEDSSAAPLRIGPQADQDPRVLAIDSRRFLPEGHPARPERLNRVDDPEFATALESMLEYGIPAPRGDSS